MQKNTQSQDERPRKGPFGAVFPQYFTSSNASEGRQAHGNDSALRPVACEDCRGGGRDRGGLDSRAGEAAQARAAEVPGVRAPLQLPRPRAGEAVKGDGARLLEVLP